MKANFAKCMPKILAYEGGWSNHPRDPGGVTLEGIIQRVYDGWRDRHGKPRRPLKPEMRNTAEWKRERDEIFRAQYWDAVKGDELPAGVDLVVFDGAVNSGPYQSIKWLQRALGVEADGHLGETTLAALQHHPDHDKLIAGICARRLGMLQQLSTWDAFGKGWARRVANVKAIGQAWATGSVGPAPVAAHEDQGDAKAYASDVAQPAVDSADAIKGGVGSGAIGATLNSVKEQIEPIAQSADWIMHLYTAITVLCVVASVAAVVYSLWSSMKAKKARRAIDGEILAAVPEGQPA
ncbi:glycoside hydrolase family 108 protein [Bradyrhizobium sp. HKCCYLR20261]|uniref:glycoside hydrolase family 108 protein n=1 Tax=Bradyrhizobium sp. HKCCYLR20261 TaxID=3420760 RepID=UPI003EBEF197